MTVHGFWIGLAIIAGVNVVAGSIILGLESVWQSRATKN